MSNMISSEESKGPSTPARPICNGPLVDPADAALAKPRPSLQDETKKQVHCHCGKQLPPFHPHQHSPSCSRAPTSNSSTPAR